MPANTLPIYTIKPDCSTDNNTALGAALVTATGDFTGVSANHVLEHTAGANGSYVRGLSFKPLGVNVASVARIYINNGSDPTNAANNAFIGELTLPPISALTNAAAMPELWYPIEKALPPSFRIYAGLGTTVAAGWDVVAWAGQY